MYRKAHHCCRDGMERKDWLALVAVHSDAWLIAVAFYYAAKLDGATRCAVNAFSATRMAVSI